MCQKPPSPMIEIERLLAVAVEGRCGGGAKAVAHRRRADVEWRIDREKMAADVGCDMVRAEFLFDQFQGREDRPLRTAGAEAGRARRDSAGECA